MAENSTDAVEGAAGAVLGLITLSDEDEDDTHTVEVDDDRFQVIDHADAKWLTLKSGVSLDFEESESVTVTVTVTDSGEPAESASAEVTIMVTDVNEAPSIDVRDGEEVPGHDGVVSSLTIEENAMRGDAPPLALIEVMDPDAADMDRLTGEAGIAATSITGEQADKFAVILDPENGLWLHLAEGASLDHEADDEVMVTVTFTDSAGNTASQDVTVMVTDVNEAPEVSGMVAAITGEAGMDLDAKPIDLLALFSDPDDGDAPVRYEISGAPDWLTFSVEYGEDDDGNDYAHGMVTGKAPTTGPDSDRAHMVTLTATDAGGEEVSTSFYVIIDDGNDGITGVDALDSNGNVTAEYEVNENDASGVVFGEIKVHDQDHAMHPNGMHHIDILMAGQNPNNVRARVDNRFEVKYDAEGLPWLALKQGMSLDEETLGGSVDVVIRAVDMDGATNARGTAFAGSVAHQTVTILINDQNDSPVAQTIGNWWVTVQDDLRSDEISKGEWLDFSLEREGIAGDDKPAFKDPDGDTLTYSLSGPSILEINPRTGQITNKEGAIPVRGMHKLTVTATDPDGASASQSFYLSIGFSEPGDNYTEDNEEPVIRVTSKVDYRENSGMKRVATFTVTDDDNDLGHHPFAVDSVRITSVVDGNTDSTDNDSTDDPSTTSVNEAQGMTGYGGAFRLSDPVKNGDTWTYHVYVRDTNPGRPDTTSVLNYENVDRITITITASDDVADAVTEEIEIRIEDVNEAPVIYNPTSDTPAVASGTYGVEQSETQKEVVYIKLEDLWTDPEGDDDPDDLTYGLTKSGSWITILHQPGEWGDIKEGRDGDEGTDDDVPWASTTNQTAVVIGDDATEPGDREKVAIIQIDRTEGNNGQGESGSYTITASDSDGATGSKTYTIRPTDKNLPPSGAVEISGSAREDATLRVTFNDDKDPDLRGSAEPALVLYEWYRVTVADGGAETEGAAPFHVGTSNTYQLKQGDVGDNIRVKVKYYEVFGGQLVGLVTSADLDPGTDGTQFNGDTTDRTVSNTPDKGSGSITILADANALMVTDRDVRVTDGDYTRADSVVTHAVLTWSWQWSSNGRGGWQNINQTGDSDTSSLELDGDPNTAGNDGDGQSRWYRAVATYNANNDDDGDDTTTEETERVYSDPIQVANINNGPSGTPVQATPAPTISGNPFPGGTLTVDAGSATVDVQWQTSRGATGDWTDIAGATGSLTLTQAHVGANIRAVVSYKSTNPNSPGVTAVVAVDANSGTAIPGGTTATATPVAVGKHDIEVGVMGTGHNPLLGTPAFANIPADEQNNAGWNLSHTEMVDLASLFQDPDSSRLTFTVTAGAASGLGARSASGNTYLFDAASGGVLVFEVQGSTGKLTFNSDVYRGHDGTGTDGTGNIITLSINANDGANDSEPDATVNLRINVAPTDIWFAAAEDSPSDAAEATTVVTVNEHVGARAGGAGPNGELVAHVNVQDENADSHKFGTHDVMVHGDDRFMVTHTGYTAAPTSRDTDRLGSTWEIRLKPGAKLDAETQMDMDPVTEGKQIVLTVTATDMGGLSTPPGAANAIKLTITVGDLDAAAGDRNHPTTPTPADVPGLKDDEATDTDDREDDTTADDDTDGGANPPPPGMSLGGIIEDFVANADAFDQDLLEDFTLMIDDGIEIA